MSSYSRIQLENWLKQIDVKAGRVLDVGGAQLPAEGRTRSWEAGEYVIMDLAEPHQIHHNAKMHKQLVRDIENPYCTDGLQEYFDVVFCLEVMEYVLSPKQAIDNLHELLAPGGILYISFPFIYPHHNPDGKDYLRYTKWAVKKLLEDVGFKIEITPKYAGSTKLLDFYSEDGMRRSKEYEGHDEIGYMVKAIKQA